MIAIGIAPIKPLRYSTILTDGEHSKNKYSIFRGGVVVGIYLIYAGKVGDKFTRLFCLKKWGVNVKVGQRNRGEINEHRER